MHSLHRIFSSTRHMWQHCRLHSWMSSSQVQGYFTHPALQDTREMTPSVQVA
jgi:hypothetical protein